MKKIKPYALEELNNKNFTNKFIEQLNYHRLGDYLAACGYVTQWLNFDDNGADFIALDHNSEKQLNIQLKGRVTLDQKYYGKNLLLAFPRNDKEPWKDWVIVPHDELMDLWDKQREYTRIHGAWSAGRVSKEHWEDCVRLSIVDPITFKSL